MKPKFLLHVCCGPCSVVIFEELQDKFDLTVHFYNPNIHPREEYDKRQAEVVKICEELDIPFVEGVYDDKRWFELTRDYQDEPEGGKRCPVCFRIRLENVAEYARDNNFDYFSTSLTMGRNKKADIINPLGVELGEKYGLKFYEEDWKKKGRQEKGNCLCKEKGVYRQDYCGCVYSRDRRHVSRIK